MSKFENKRFIKEKEESKSLEESTPGCYVKARYVLAVMGLLGNFLVYSTRISLSVAIVAMVNNTKAVTLNNTRCPDNGWREDDVTGNNGIFDWDMGKQGLLLGCYFYGYTVSNVPGGWMAKRFGVRLVFGGAMFFSSIITLLSPLMAVKSFALLVTFRILLGFLQGVSSPSMTSAWGKWAPPLERSKLISIHMSGSCLGTFVSLPIAGVVADRLGWEAVFYVTGAANLIWSVAFLLTIHNSPAVHPRISKQEKVFIENSIGEHKKDKDEKNLTPWCAMLMSFPVWAIIVGHFASNWGNYTLMNMLPMYMAKVLGFNLSASGALSSLPFILQFLFTIIGGYITDVIRSRNIMSTVNVRKLNTTLGLVVPAFFIVLAGYIGCNVSAAVAFFSLSVAFNALTVPGCKANAVDIAPKYGGIIYGMSNTVASAAGFLSPQIVGFMLMGEETIQQWQGVFWLSAAIYCLGALFYFFVASGVKQRWAGGTSYSTSQDDVGLQS